ncbi:response regulator [Desulfococcaceae bacterium HSG7]|nr:response regulator [Desulfococcaceae bacterium HSG9]MDM8553930.1 response regulator [Desulfococcaceae bacterium HSG7]
MGKRILIVDDSSLMRKMIRKTLEPKGHEIVGEATNGKEAFEKYKALKPDFVTMDVTMRGVDGFMAAQTILNYDDAARIIFLSNLNKEQYSKDAASLGAVGYVNKHKSRQILDLLEN